jgi:hypothetical protein
VERVMVQLKHASIGPQKRDLRDISTTLERYLHRLTDLKPALPILSSKTKSRLAEPSPPAKRLSIMEVVKELIKPLNFSW